MEEINPAVDMQRLQTFNSSEEYTTLIWDNISSGEEYETTLNNYCDVNTSIDDAPPNTNIYSKESESTMDKTSNSSVYSTNIETFV